MLPLLHLNLLMALVAISPDAVPAEPADVHATPVVANADGWVRPRSALDPPIWGRVDGLVFGLPDSPDKGAMPGPRGLLRVGIVRNGRAELINFIAVEPVVKGVKAYSELEPSRLDGVQGKRLEIAEGTPRAGRMSRVSRSGPQQLSVRITVEPFDNSAALDVVASIRADRPREVTLAVFRRPGSAPVEEATLSATMGNYERLRLLWLRGRTVDSRLLFADEPFGPDGFGFTVDHFYPREQLHRSPEGDLIVAATSNEPDPAAVPVPNDWWQYRSVPLTQYWRVPAAEASPELRVRVNGRRVYWAGTLPIPGGASFENFELRQPFKGGQRVTFGLTPAEPAALYASPPVRQRS